MTNKFSKFIFVLVLLGCGFFFAQTASAATYYNQILISGTLNPNVAATFTAIGMYNDYPLYQRRSDGWYLVKVSTFWFITSDYTTQAGKRWYKSGTDLNGTYAGQNGATGTATAADVVASGIFWNTGDPTPTPPTITYSPTTYYVRADGTAANAAAATGPTTDSTKTMSLTTFTAQSYDTFVPGDTIYFSALGGAYTATSSFDSIVASLNIVSSGNASADISYVGLLDGEGGTKPLINVAGDTSNPIGILVNGKNYVTIQNFQIRGSGKGAAAFSFTGSSGLAGSGYTVKGRDIDVLSNQGSPGGDCFASGSATNANNQAEFWNITASGCREDGAPTSSNQAFTLHEYAKAKVHGATFSDSNYWILNTKDTELEIDNLTATTPRTAGIMFASNSTALYSITVTNSNLSLGSTGDFIIGQAGANAAATIEVSSSIINLGEPNGSGDSLLGILKLYNNEITINSSSWNLSMPAGSSLYLYNNIYKISGLDSTIYQLTGGTADIYNNTIYNSSSGGTFVNQTVGTLNLKNNIFENISDVLSTSGGTANISNNIYYNSSNEGGTGSLTSNPLFTVAGTDFSLLAGSPVMDAGADLGSDYDDALLSGSTWPSSVLTGLQNSYGNGWEIGAYIYPFPISPTIGTPAVLSSSSIRWNFTDTTSGETGFRIYDSTNTLATSSATANLSYLDETGLSENTQYSGRYATAYNSAGNSASSSAATAIYTLVDTPTNFSASSNSNSVTLSVDSFPNDTSGQSGYYFSRSGTNSGWIQTNSWTDTGLSCGHSYDYSVIYRNGDGTETSSISTTKSTSGCGGGGSPAMWTLPITPSMGFKLNINGGAVTTSNRNVILGFNAGTDIKKMAISMTGDFTDANQEDYVAFKQWDLCSKLGGAVKNPTCLDGQYKVYVQFYTVYGRTTGNAFASSTIVLKSAATSTENLQINNLPFTNSFTKYLKYKQTNADIKRLQIFLNSDPDTRVAGSGVGSPGKETNYFGELTKKAVIKFQEKYAKDVLVPWGFKKGTGYVGKTTLLKINELIKSK